MNFQFVHYRNNELLISVRVDSIFIEDKFESPLGLDSMTIDDAIEVIQKNERGRQGVERAAIYRSNRLVRTHKSAYVLVTQYQCVKKGIALKRSTNSATLYAPLAAIFSTLAPRNHHTPLVCTSLRRMTLHYTSLHHTELYFLRLYSNQLYCTALHCTAFLYT